jgi:hypothetical protein
MTRVSVTNAGATVVVVVEVLGTVVVEIEVVVGVVVVDNVVEAGAVMAIELEASPVLAGNDVVAAAPSEEHASKSCDAMRGAAHHDRRVNCNPLNSG